jgi:hypothetical protein
MAPVNTARTLIAYCGVLWAFVLNLFTVTSNLIIRCLLPAKSMRPYTFQYEPEARQADTYQTDTCLKQSPKYHNSQAPSRIRGVTIIDDQVQTDNKYGSGTKYRQLGQSLVRNFGKMSRLKALVSRAL